MSLIDISFVSPKETGNFKQKFVSPNEEIVIEKNVHLYYVPTYYNELTSKKCSLNKFYEFPPFSRNSSESYLQ